MTSESSAEEGVRERTSSLGHSAEGIALTLGVLWAIAGFPLPSPPQRTFSVDAWKAAPRLHRYWMAEDYLRTRDVKSMSLTDVVRDLGDPDSCQNWWSYTFVDAASAPASSRPARRSPGEGDLMVRFSGDQRVSRLSYDDRFKARSTTPFDAAAWRTADWPERHCMLEALVTSKQCVGLTEAELVALLGPPDHRCEQPWIKYCVANSLADYEFLEFRGNEAGSVVWAKLYDG